MSRKMFLINDVEVGETVVVCASSIQEALQMWEDADGLEGNQNDDPATTLKAVLLPPKEPNSPARHVDLFITELPATQPVTYLWKLSELPQHHAVITKVLVATGEPVETP